MTAVKAFLGVPYGVASRFEHPSEAPSWTGDLDAREPGPAAPQLPSRLEGVMGPATLHTSESECLTLNIWTPDTDGSRPVLFWLHGGAWVSGSAGWPWYDGARLAADEDIVVVTANYRLGALGYLHLADLVPGAVEGNLGFADQAAALTWVAREIAAFGGDPARITVGGQSAGGHAAALLASSYPTRDLVRRVFIQSAPLEWPLQSRTEAVAVATEFIGELAVRPSQAALLHDLPADDLLTATVSLARRRRRFANIVPPFLPTATDLLPWTSPLDALDRGARDDLDVLVGATSDEMRAFYDADPQVTDASRETVIAELDREFGKGDRLYVAYDKDETDQTPGRILSRAVGDAHFQFAALAAAEIRERRGSGAFVYQFDWQGGSFGACHCIDLPFLLGSEGAWANAPMLDQPAPASGRSVTARAFRGAVGRFVREGDPGWNPFSATDPSVMRFGVHSSGAAIEARPDWLERRSLFRPARRP